MRDVCQDFCDAVLAACPRATKAEREEMRRELLDHLEDRTLDMAERDWPEEEARARAVAAMGDPAAIGRDWNDQLSPFWLRMDWLARLLLTLVALVLFFSVSDNVVGISNSLRARYGTLKTQRFGYFDALWDWALDERVDMGDFQLRFYQAGLFSPDEAMPYRQELGEGQYELRLSVACYSRNPFYPGPALNILDGPGEDWKSGGWSSSAHVTYQNLYTVVEAGQPFVTLRLDNDFGSCTLELPLEWRELP